MRGRRRRRLSVSARSLSSSETLFDEHYADSRWTLCRLCFFVEKKADGGWKNHFFKCVARSLSSPRKAAPCASALRVADDPNCTVPLAEASTRRTRRRRSTRARCPCTTTPSSSPSPRATASSPTASRARTTSRWTCRRVEVRVARLLRRRDELLADREPLARRRGARPFLRDLRRLARGSEHRGHEGQARRVAMHSAAARYGESSLARSGERGEREKARGQRGQGVALAQSLLESDLLAKAAAEAHPARAREREEREPPRPTTTRATMAWHHDQLPASRVDQIAELYRLSRLHDHPAAPAVRQLDPHPLTTRRDPLSTSTDQHSHSAQQPVALSTAPVTAASHHNEQDWAARAR